MICNIARWTKPFILHFPNKLKNKYVFSVVSICLILSINSVDERPRPLDCSHFDFERIWKLPTPSWRMPRLSNNEQERYSEIAHHRKRKFIKVVRNYYLISQLLKSFAFFSKRKSHCWLTIMFSETMKLWMIGIDPEEAQHQKTPEGLGFNLPIPIHFYFNFKVGFNSKLLIKIDSK